MVEYNKIDLHLTDSQLKKTQNAVKNNHGTTIRLSNENFNKNNLIHELYLTERQMKKLIKKIDNNMSTDIKLSKTQINKTIKEGGNLGRLLMNFLPKLIKPAISIRRNILAPLGLTAAMSATDAAIQKKIYGSGSTKLIISVDDLDEIIKIVTALKEHDILLKRTAKTIKNETKEQKGGFLSMLLGTLGASLLGNLLTDKGLYRTGQGMYRTGQPLKKLIPFHVLENFEIMDYFYKIKRVNGVFSRNNLPKLKNAAYAINLDHRKNTGTHWIVIFLKNNEVIYFDSFGVIYLVLMIFKKMMK